MVRPTNKSTSAGKEVHIICDSYGKHKHPEARVVAELRRGVFHRVPEARELAIAYLKKHDQAPVGAFNGSKLTKDVRKRANEGAKHSITYSICRVRQAIWLCV